MFLENSMYSGLETRKLGQFRKLRDAAQLGEGRKGEWKDYKSLKMASGPEPGPNRSLLNQ